ncbi:licheninase [Saccharibacillus sp. O23]|uniref:carbohydrate binding domain-containing protein n=1 Tax=Saccharibacillus sp. O23 TaxID=2009338 RepID=UPI000B4DF7A3|nr:carbohydrate binding domain-containing protein [Saccharibacillus sp. O23]OWR27103.1 licheninase [Saccharibacillus sp. O23]
MKKSLVCLVASSMIASLAVPAAAGAAEGKPQTAAERGQASSLLSAPYTDLQGHWAENAAARLRSMALSEGYADGTFRPGEPISRAEFAVILDRAFGFAGDQAAGSYVDLSEKDWYYDALTRASGSGILQGTDASHLSPKLAITRQDAMVMADRAFGLSTGGENDTLNAAFRDGQDVAGYARQALSYFVKQKIVNGYNGGLNPKSEITRAEAAVLLSSMIADVRSVPGTYESDVNGNLIVRSADATLKNMTVNGNLLLTEAIGEGTVTLEGVTVTGSVIVRGGGSHSINIQDSKLNRVVVDKKFVPVHLTMTGTTQIEEMVVERQSELELAAESTIATLKVNSRAARTAIEGTGVIKQFEVSAADVSLNGKTVAPGRYADGTAPGSVQVQSTPSKPASPSASAGGGNSSNTGGNGSSNPGGTTPSVPGTPSGEKPVPSTTIPDEQWQMVWNDEFDGSAVDASKWTVQDTELVYNNELQYYSPDNTRIAKDGSRSVLQIEAKKQQKGSKNYTSGKLITKEKGDWTYGKVVVRAKLPTQQGMWPAIWMMPTDEAHYGGWPASGEIDIMELIGGAGKDHETYSTIHYDSVKADGSHGHDQGKFTLPQGESFADDYHDFQVEWLPGMIRFYVDGKLHHQINNWQTTAAGQPESYTFPAPFDRPFYLILNLAVGGDWPGAPDSAFVSEQMNVDFVRVYSYKNLDQWPDVTSAPIEPERQRAPQADGNQIYNEAFAKGSDASGVPADWKFIENAGGKGKVEVVDDPVKGRAAKVSISEAGTESYSIQLTQMPMYLQKNKKYKVEFEAKASANRTLRSKVTQFEKSWTNYSGEKSFPITTDWQPYSYEFDMRGGSDNNARFEFNLGLEKGEAWVTNVKLTEIGEADPVQVERKALPDGNYVYNGTFDQGKERLGFWKTEIQPGAEAQVSVNNFLKFPIMERQLVVDVKKTNGQPQQVAVVQPGLKLESDTAYGFSFEAKADTAGIMDLGLSTAEGHDVQITQGQQLQIASEMKTYSGEISIGAGEQVATSELRLLFGGSTGKVYVDNVRLTKRGKAVGFSNYVHIPAADAYAMQGLQLEDSSEGGKHVSYMDEGDRLQFKITPAGDGPYIFSTRMASAKADAKVRFSVQDENGVDVANTDLVLGDTGGWQTYRTVYLPAVTLEAGKTYYVNFEGSEYNTRWLDISRSQVKNGELSAAAADWTIPSAATATAYSSEQGISLTLPSTTQNWWDAILQQGQLSLEAGKTYRLSFDASASADKSIQVVVSKTGSDEVKYLDQPAALTTASQSYAYTFTMGETADDNALLNFGLGNPPTAAGEHQVSIRNVRLFEVNSAADQGGQPVQVNLIANGDFSNGTTGWFPYAAGDKPDALTISADNGKLQAKIAQVGENPWDRQLIQEGFAMQKGYTYKLTFTAKADKARKLGLGIGWVDVPANYEWTGFYGNRVDLATEEQEFTFTFPATEDSYANSRIVFDMGKIDGTEQADTTIALSGISLVNLGKTQ